MSYRQRILAAFRNLHKARREVFEGDAKALSETRQTINNEFRKHLKESNASQIEEKLALAKDVAFLLRGTVVQLEQKNDDTFEIHVKKDTIFPKNTPYDPTIELPSKPRRKKCSDYTEPGA